MFLGAEAMSLALRLTLQPIMAYSQRFDAPTNPQYTCPVVMPMLAPSCRPSNAKMISFEAEIARTSLSS